MTKEERRTYWKQIVDEQIVSGLSASIFCQEHNLKVSQFYRWRRKFQDLTPVRSSNGFIQLIPTTKGSGSGSGIRIRLFDDLCIEIDRGFDPFTLRAAVETLYTRKGSKP
jgi:hypothetical protein